MFLPRQWLHYLAKKLLFAKRLKPPMPITTTVAVPESPRSLPSPRKMAFARRHTLAGAGASAASAGPFSPPAPAHRRPRTQPGSLLPGGRKAVSLERESEAERRAYHWLQDVADALDRLVEDAWRLDGRLSKRSKAATKKAAADSRSRQRARADLDVSGVTCASTLAAALFK